jgi:hypothetical protein
MSYAMRADSTGMGKINLSYMYLMKISPMMTVCCACIPIELELFLSCSCPAHTAPPLCSATNRNMHSFLSLIYVCFCSTDPLGRLFVDLTRFENGVVGFVDEKLQEIKKGTLQLAITVEILGD